jgi:hypothetical protein
MDTISISISLNFSLDSRLVLACQRLQAAERDAVMEPVTRMDVDPVTKTKLATRLNVSLLMATNLPRTRWLTGTCDSYAVLHLERYNR